MDIKSLHEKYISGELTVYSYIESLYERIGFKEFNKKRVKIGSFERGMHNMELKL